MDRQALTAFGAVMPDAITVDMEAVDAAERALEAAVRHLDEHPYHTLRDYMFLRRYTLAALLRESDDA
jgi:hypothetical protein